LDKLLEINQAEFTQKADAYAAVIGQKKARVDFLKAEAKRLTRMAQVEESIADKLKERISYAMTAHGLEKVETAHYKLGWRKSSTVEITGQIEDLPIEFVRVKVEADKAAIKASFKAGEPVRGARIVENKTLSIR
jgi:hypothetical protein